MEFHTPHETVVSIVRLDSSGRILRFALTLTLIPARFPSRSGGNLKEGGNYELWLGDWSNLLEVKTEPPP